MTEPKRHPQRPEQLPYTVTKHDQMNGNFSLIHCPNFDTSPEPTPGNYAVMKSDGIVKVRSPLSNPYDNHLKRHFVHEVMHA